MPWTQKDCMPLYTALHNAKAAVSRAIVFRYDAGQYRMQIDIVSAHPALEKFGFKPETWQHFEAGVCVTEGLLENQIVVSPTAGQRVLVVGHVALWTCRLALELSNPKKGYSPPGQVCRIYPP